MNLFEIRLTFLHLLVPSVKPLVGQAPSISVLVAKDARNGFILSKIKCEMGLFLTAEEAASAEKARSWFQAIPPFPSECS